MVAKHTLLCILLLVLALHARASAETEEFGDFDLYNDDAEDENENAKSLSADALSVEPTPMPFAEHKKPGPPKGMDAVLMYIHMFGMAFAWAICASFGIIVAQSKVLHIGVFFDKLLQKYLSRWNLIHTILFCTVVLVSIVAVICMIVKHKGEVFFGGTVHDFVGYTVVFGCVLQACLGFISNITFKFTKRVFPEYIHQYLGKYVVACELTLVEFCGFWECSMCILACLPFLEHPFLMPCFSFGLLY